MVEAGIETFERAVKHIKNGNYTKAIELFDKLISALNHNSSIVTRNNFIISEFEYLNDISDCEKKVNNCKNPYEGYIALSLLFKLAGNNDRRKIFIRKALKLNSTNARIWRDYGETDFHLGNIREALQHFQEAIVMDNKDSISLEGLGLCYYYLDEPIKAISPLRKALSFNPNNHSIMNHLAFLLSEVGELEEALTLIQQALVLDKGNIIYQDTYACILFLQEKYDEALKTFEEILDQNPKDIEISWDILFNLYEIKGLHVKAKQLEEKLRMA